MNLYHCHECGDVFEGSGRCSVDRVPLTHVSDLDRSVIASLMEEGAVTHDELAECRGSVRPAPEAAVTEGQWRAGA